MIREWKAFLIPYEQAVEELKIKFKSLRNQYRELSEYSPIEFVTGRVKKISSIIEKADRRDIPESEIGEIMEDIAGIRIMCQFIDDIYTVVDMIKERDGKDFVIVDSKDYITNQKESGYKSYHIIIKYPVHTALGTQEVLAEIQIRTLAMNFWATIEHSLNYKYKSNIPESVKKRLQKSAVAATLLDQEMCEIRKEIVDAQLLFEQWSNIVKDIAYNIRSLEREGNVSLAFEFQRRFEALKDSTDIEALNDLLKEIKSHLPKYSMFDIMKEEINGKMDQ